MSEYVAEQCSHQSNLGLVCERNKNHRETHRGYDIRSKMLYQWACDGVEWSTVDLDEERKLSVLDEAKSIVAGARATEYGEGAENSLPRIAAYWSTYLGRELSARDAANMMVLLKMARESHKPKRDNHVDAIGYLALAEQCDGSESG